MLRAEGGGRGVSAGGDVHEQPRQRPSAARRPQRRRGAVQPGPRPRAGVARARRPSAAGAPQQLQRPPGVAGPHGRGRRPPAT
eukprot:scaffold650993_cov27-Prasinocladus_malaysianus.AAC.1